MAFPSHLRMRRLPGTDYEAAELGSFARAGPEQLLAAAGLVRQGIVYDLDAGRWPGMPTLPSHPAFVLTTYRTPQGLAVDGDLEGFAREPENVSFLTELLVSSTHTGTHLDALNHVACGSPGHFFGGYPAAETGDFGTRRAEASSLLPILCRGVLVDVAGHHGVEALQADHEVSWPETEAILTRQGVEIREHDAVLFRTGSITAWQAGAGPTAVERRAGIDVGTAVELGERGVALVGSDTENVEVIPSRDPRNPLPAHVELLVRRGIYMLELAYLDDLARDRVYEFLFVCLPLRVRGATGSMVRPIALV